MKAITMTDMQYEAINEILSQATDGELETHIDSGTIDDIGRVIRCKMAIVNMVKRDKSYWDNNIRTNPIYSEFTGMCQILKLLGIEYEIDWNKEVTEMTAITIQGKRFEV